MNVSQLVALAFASASQRLPEIHKVWIGVSFRIGGRLPNSRMMVSVQRAGELDMVLRCMEDDFKPPAGNLFDLDAMAVNHQIALSEFWIVQVYDFLLRLKNIERHHGGSDPAFLQLLHDIKLIRVPLTKWEIADDSKLKAPLMMGPSPPAAGEPDDAHNVRAYVPGNPLRSHNMPTAMSTGGSVEWLALDVVAKTETWCNRRSLSDRIVKHFSASISKQP